MRAIDLNAFEQFQRTVVNDLSKGQASKAQTAQTAQTGTAHFHTRRPAFTTQQQHVETVELPRAAGACGGRIGRQGRG